MSIYKKFLFNKRAAVSSLSDSVMLTVVDSGGDACRVELEILNQIEDADEGGAASSDVRRYMTEVSMEAIEIDPSDPRFDGLIFLPRIVKKGEGKDGADKVSGMLYVSDDFLRQGQVTIEKDPGTNRPIDFFKLAGEVIGEFEVTCRNFSELGLLSRVAAGIMGGGISFLPICAPPFWPLIYAVHSNFGIERMTVYISFMTSFSTSALTTALVLEPYTRTLQKVGRQMVRALDRYSCEALPDPPTVGGVCRIHRDTDGSYRFISMSKADIEAMGEAAKKDK